MRRVLGVLALLGMLGCGGGDEGSYTSTYTLKVSGYAIDPPINGTAYIYLYDENTGQFVSTPAVPIKDGRFSFSREVNRSVRAVFVCAEGTDGVNIYTRDNGLCIPLSSGNGVLISPFHALVESLSEKRTFLSALEETHGITYKISGFSSYSEAENYVKSIIQVLETEVASLGGRTPTAIEWYIGLLYLYDKYTLISWIAELSPINAQAVSTPNASTATTVCTLYSDIPSVISVQKECTEVNSGIIDLAIAVDEPYVWYKPAGSQELYRKFAYLEAKSQLEELYGLPCDLDPNNPGNEVFISASPRFVSCTFEFDQNGVWNGRLVCDVEATVTVGIGPRDTVFPVCQGNWTNGEVIYGRFTW